MITFTRSLYIVLTWLGAAVLVASAHELLDPISATGAAMTGLALIGVMAFVYMRVCTHDTDASHALGVGIAWLTMSIITEMILTRMGGRGWYGLLGSPAHPLLRNLFPFAWIFIPVLFARTSAEEAVR